MGHHTKDRYPLCPIPLFYQLILVFCSLFPDVLSPARATCIISTVSFLSFKLNCLFSIDTISSLVPCGAVAKLLVFSFGLSQCSGHFAAVVSSQQSSPLFSLIVRLVVIPIGYIAQVHCSNVQGCLLCKSRANLGFSHGDGFLKVSPSAF